MVKKPGKVKHREALRYRSQRLSREMVRTEQARLDLIGSMAGLEMSEGSCWLALLRMCGCIGSCTQRKWQQWMRVFVEVMLRCSVAGV